MKRKKSDIIVITITASLFLVLIVLTAILLLAMRQSSSRNVPFDLSEITADKTVDATDISDCFLPEMIGLTVGGMRSGLVGSENTMRELYAILSPAISEALDRGAVREGTEEEWRGLADEENSAFIRYHSELPDAVIALFADLERGIAPAETDEIFYIDEIFLIPYVNGANQSVAAARNRQGEVRIYTVTMPMEILSSEDLAAFVRSYLPSLTPFAYRVTADVLQPVFSEALTVRGILMTQNTAVYAQESREDTNRLLRIFGLNPDKLLSMHMEEEQVSCIGTQGALTIGTTMISYASTSEGGIGLNDLIGYADGAGIAEYVRACLILMSEIKALNRNYAGGDAGVLLESIRAEGGAVSLRFVYEYDNLVIADMPAALTAEFENGLLRDASVYTVTVGGSRSTRTQTMAEWWFYRWLENQNVEPKRASLVYRADFLSENVAAEWGAE